MSRWLRQDVTMRRWAWLLLVAVAVVAAGFNVFDVAFDVVAR